MMKNFADMTFEVRCAITPIIQLAWTFPDGPSVPGVLILDEVRAAC